MLNFRHFRGITLIEVMIGVFLSTLLVSGIVQLVAGSVSSYRMQLSQGQLEESVRYARDVLITHIAQAGYQPEPWINQPGLSALTSETLEGGALFSDRLGLQRWSMRNCYGNENPVTDGDGQPVFHLLRVRFQVNAGNNLAITCSYGPDDSQLTTQINNYGLIEDVESMQILYAEDRDGDAIADSWVTGQAWQKESNIRAVKIGLLLSTRHPIKQRVSEQITLLDTTITTPADGHLRKVGTLTSAIRGRLN